MHFMYTVYGPHGMLRPISLLRLSLLRLLDSDSPGNFPMGMRIPPLTFKIKLESNPPKSRILVRRLAALKQRRTLQNAVRRAAGLRRALAIALSKDFQPFPAEHGQNYY